MSPWPRETRLENIRIIQLTDYCQYSPSCFSLQHSSRSFESLNTFPNWKKWVSHILILTVTSAMTVEGVYKVGHNTVSGFCLRIWNATKCIWLACWQIVFHEGHIQIVSFLYELMQHVSSSDFFESTYNCKFYNWMKSSF